MQASQPAKPNQAWRNEVKPGKIKPTKSSIAYHCKAKQTKQVKQTQAGKAKQSKHAKQANQSKTRNQSKTNNQNQANQAQT